MLRLLLVILLLLQSYTYPGFDLDTLIKTENGLVPLKELSIGQNIQCCTTNHFNRIIFKRSLKVDSCIQLAIQGLQKPLIVSTHQKFYMPEKFKWQPAHKLKIGDKLLSKDNNFAQIIKISKPESNIPLIDISIDECHTFLVTELEILVHNVFFLPVLTASFVFGSGVIEFLGITCGLATVAGVLGIKLLKDKESSTFGNLEIDFNPRSSTASTYLESRAPGKPTENDGYFPPKRWNGEKVKNPNGPGYGYPDDKGSVWIPTGPNGHGGPHWDVEHPDGTYDNVVPGGKIIGKK